jgi:hypothetical protein
MIAGKTRVAAITLRSDEKGVCFTRDCADPAAAALFHFYKLDGLHQVQPMPAPTDQDHGAKAHYV